MVKEDQKIFAQTTTFLHGEGPVFYASLPCGPGQKHRLISGLFHHLETMKNPPWIPRPDDNTFPVQVGQAADAIQVIRGPLGRPQLLLGGDRGPAISFSGSGRTVWAAMCGDDHEIGIDVAHPHEFQGDYPVYRVFHPQELQYAVNLLSRDLKKAAALLWSIKEAVAKAMGCAFHLLDPRQIIVYPSMVGQTGDNTDRATDGAAGGAAKKKGSYDFLVELSKKAAKRFPMAAGRALRVRSVYREKMWLSIALLNWQQRPDDRRSRFTAHTQRYRLKFGLETHDPKR
jgi:phosphopantetheinyl transferase (holo-ACP synthase)